MKREGSSPQEDDSLGRGSVARKGGFGKVSLGSGKKVYNKSGVNGELLAVKRTFARSTSRCRSASNFSFALCSRVFVRLPLAPYFGGGEGDLDI